MNSQPNLPEQNQPLSLEQKLAEDRSNADRWGQVAESPNLSLPAALAARNVARSYRAAVVLSQKALQNQQAENDPEAQNQLMLALGINPLLPAPAPSSKAKNRNSPTKPGTSGLTP